MAALLLTTSPILMAIASKLEATSCILMTTSSSLEAVISILAIAPTKHSVATLCAYKKLCTQRGHTAYTKKAWC